MIQKKEVWLFFKHNSFLFSTINFTHILVHFSSISKEKYKKKTVNKNKKQISDVWVFFLIKYIEKKIMYRD
jgi:hypothetical protein